MLVQVEVLRLGYVRFTYVAFPFVFLSVLLLFISIAILSHLSAYVSLEIT